MNTLVCGRMKEGKTTFALWLARHWQSGGAIAWDPRHMIDTEMARPAGWVNVTYAYTKDELEYSIDNYDQFAKGTLIVYRPLSMDLEKDFTDLCSVMLDPPEKYHRWALVIDEAAQLQSAHQIVPQLSRAIRQHPRSVLIVQTTHSLQDWHRASKDLTNHLFCFRLVGRSLVAVIDFCDGSQEMEETISDLPPHHMVHISFESQQGAQEFDVIKPESWYAGEGRESGEILAENEDENLEEDEGDENESDDDLEVQDL